MLSTEIWLRVVSGILISTVMFGAGAVTVLSIPALAEQAKYLIPDVAIVSVVMTPVLSGLIAPRMRFSHWGRRGWREGDFISGGAIASE